MIDLKSLRGGEEALRRACASRGGRYLPALADLIALDSRQRERLGRVEALRARRNAASKSIGAAMAAGDTQTAEALKAEAGRLKGELESGEEELRSLTAALRQAALGLPNPPHESVPQGRGPEDNRVARAGPPPREKTFKVADHQTAGERLGILDFGAGAGLAGSRFALLRGAGARLERALSQWMLDEQLGRGYEEVCPPLLARPEILEGTGQLPKFAADLYRTAAGEGEAHELYLIPTAEVPLTNLVRGQILPETALPMKLAALTACFRQESGSYGKDVRGMIRNHQFNKVELVWIAKPEDSLAALERLTADAEAVLKALELPYQVVELCAGDLGFSSRKTYDLEVWMAAEGKFREVSSCSDCGDFQARRMNARFRRGPQGDPEFVHTLNGSGVAAGRLFAAILENGQQADGSVVVPDVLRARFGAASIAPPGAAAR